MKTTTRLNVRDKLALYSLWFIFPLRLLAESFTAGQYGGGGFVTHYTGAGLASFLPVADLAYPAWWAYSSALGLFFVMLPYSRYMHIPTEIFLIFFRYSGIKNCRANNSLRKFHLNACSRCGICIDGCPTGSIAGIHGSQAVYMIKQTRHFDQCEPHALNSCMLCGRCETNCPVGIETLNIRIAQRAAQLSVDNKIADHPVKSCHEIADVFYFPGCISKLTPAITQSFRQLMQQAGVNYTEGTGLCCGKPSLQAGFEQRAKQLAEENIRHINQSGARMVVSNCPICCHMLSSEYGLRIPVLHHSQLLLQLLEEKKLEVSQSNLTLTYHDPCELARNMGITKEPRRLLAMAGNLQEIVRHGKETNCCGGSLGNLELDARKQALITDQLVHQLTTPENELIVTGCPLCKRTIGARANKPVKDIAEVLWEATRTQMANTESKKYTTPEEINISLVC